MLSKCLSHANRFKCMSLLRDRAVYSLPVARPPQLVSRRGILGLIPPSQYDTPFPNKFRLMWAMKEYWEIIPLILVTAFDIVVVMGGFIIWASKNKVDVVFTTHSRANISRTMDLNNPSVHKMIIINQRYERWPEMQKILDKMAAAEKRALVRLQSCAHP